MCVCSVSEVNNRMGADGLRYVEHFHWSRSLLAHDHIYFISICYHYLQGVQLFVNEKQV